MSKNKRTVTENIDNLEPLSALKPKEDRTFTQLRDAAFDGEVPTYFATVPMRLIRPFDTDFYPQSDPDGEAAILIEAEWIAVEQPPVIWVYPMEGMFVLSDDYIAYEAYRLAGEDFLPCFILGDATAPGIEGVQGPVELEEVRELMYAPRVSAER